MILITGGSGFLGRQVCEQLTNEGHPVLNASLNPGQITGYPSQQVDIAQAAELESLFSHYSFDTIIHLAALLHTESWKNPSDAFRVNIQGSFNLLELSRQYHIRRFVFGSTVDALGYYPPEEGGVTEEVEILPADLYGETKRFIEKLGLAYRQIYGLGFISARIPFIVGPGPTTPTSAWRMDIFNLLKSGGEIDFGFEADAVIPIAHVLDSAVETCALATASSIKHSIYNLPCESIRVSDLAAAVETFGKNIRIKFGTKKGDFYPAFVDSSRFQEEFNIAHLPLVTRLEEYRLRLDN